MNNVSLPVEDLTNLLIGMSKYIGMTKEASVRQSTNEDTLDGSRLENAVEALCAQGLMAVEKRASVIESIQIDPNKICDLLEKIASRAGPSALGASDTESSDGSDPDADFEVFCLS